jgi:cytochrome c oxidase assembly factor CtaG/polyferredoxin
VSESITDAIAASWALPFWPTLALFLTGVVYWRGWRAARLTRPQELPGWRAACFLAGLTSVWLAIASPLDALGGWLLLAHMGQHLVLMSVAPPLLLLGNPSVPLLRGLPRSWVRDGLGPLFSERPLRVAFRFLTHPATAWISMNAAYLGWHVPAAYELALRYDAWHQAEHACFLFTSLIFWWNVLEPWPAHARWSRLAMVPYLIAADVVNTALSAFLVFSGRVLYPTYAAMPRLFGMSAAQDQAAAGSFMWVAGSAIYWVPAIAITFRLLSRPRHALVTIGGAPARGMLAETNSAFDLLRTPFVGAFLRARYGRQTLQAASLLGVGVIIAHGLFGPRMAAVNLAGVLPWNFVRAGGVMALLFFGNLFCMACPFTLPRELARRLGWARLRWPRLLRSKWIGVALLLGFFFSYEHFSLWNSPARTAWLLIAYIVAAFALDSLFEGAGFCKYVCPIGQFNFVAALLSPTTLRVRSQTICASCTTHDCVRGNAMQRGCELDLYLPQKRSNADCTLCMDCVKACPHDNIGIVPRSLTEDLLAAGPTSSVGRLHHRLDVAAVAGVVVLGAFGSAAAMVAPGRAAWGWAEARSPMLSTGAGSAASVLAVALLCTAVLWAVSAIGEARGTPSREHFCQAALALLPLGLGMWAAHLLFHLVAGAPSLLPLVRQAAQDLGSTLLGQPNWSLAGAGGAGSWLLQAQLLLLDAGLLLSLYCVWRMGPESPRRMLASAPMAVLILALYSLGFWLLLAPMQMRGMVAMGAM